MENEFRFDRLPPERPGAVALDAPARVPGTGHAGSHASEAAAPNPARLNMRWGRIGGRLGALGIILGLALAFTLPAQAGVSLLSTTTTSNLYPQINNSGWVVWDGYVSGVGEGVYLWNGSSVQKVSFGSSVELGLQVNDNGQVIWCSRLNLLSPGSVTVKLFSWNGSSVQQLTNDQGFDVDVIDPQLSSTGQIAWVRGNAAPRQIALWTGSAEEVLTNDTTDNRNPQISNSGEVVWEHYDGAYWQIELWNGSSVQALTNGSMDHLNPQINNAGQVVWQAGPAGHNNIYLWNGSSVRQFTSGQQDDEFPQINNKGQIAWVRWDAGWDIWLWDGSSMRQLTSDAYLERADLRMNDAGQVVWSHNLDSSATEVTIDLWNGAYIQQLDSYRAADDQPVINNAGQVAWHGRDGATDQVYLYTPTAPAAPTGLTASAASPSQINLTWTDNSDNEFAFAVWRSENGGTFARVAALAANTTSYADTGLTAGSSYTYEVRAVNSVGPSPWSNQVTVALVPPAAPTGLGALATSSTQISLTWTDNSNNETAYAVWRSDNGGTFARVAALAPHSSSYTDSGLTAGSTYTYEVRAVNLVGPSAWSNQVAVALAPPAAPTGLTASAASPSQINVAWTDNSNNETALAVWRSDNGGTFVRIAPLAAGTTSYVDSGLTPGATYSYEVRAVNLVGPSAWSNQVTVALAPPAAPTGLTVSSLSGTAVGLSWTDNSNNETAFAVWRSANGGAFARIAPLAAHTTSYVDTAVTAETTYTYEVRAVNLVGPSAWSNQVTATPTNLLPAAPTNLAASAISSSQIRLTWTDNSYNEVAFAIWRQTGSGSFVRVGLVGSDIITYTDTGLAPGTTYTYEVRAINNVGPSAWSNQVTAATSP